MIALYIVVSLIAVYLLVFSVIVAIEVPKIMDRDPAARNPIEIFLLYSGLHAVANHRIAHIFYKLNFEYYSLI